MTREGIINKRDHSWQQAEHIWPYSDGWIVSSCDLTVGVLYYTYYTSSVLHLLQHKSDKNTKL